MPYELTTEHMGSVSRRILRWRLGESTVGTDCVVEEFPVALVFNDIAHAVMMATPFDLEAFAVGFALSEGIVERAADVYDLEVFTHAASAEVRLTIAQPAFLQLKGKRRALAGRSGCGVCGIESIELLDLQPQKIEFELVVAHRLDLGVVADFNVELDRAAELVPNHLGQIRIDRQHALSRFIRLNTKANHAVVPRSRIWL
jgi:FdhD protein